jgi:signal peptidase II
VRADGEVAVTGPASKAEPEATTSVPVRFTGRALGVLVAIAIVVVGTDSLLKQLVLTKLTDHEPVRVLGGVLYFDVIRNSGAAFSLGTHVTFVFPLVTVVVLGWIGWMATRLRSVPWAVSLGLVVGGALGNMVDRVFRAPGFLVGHVVDFISLFGPNGEHFAIFNLADTSLTCGVALAILLELTGHRRDGTRARSGKATIDTSTNGDAVDRDES